ncbi:TPA: hypothetical protein ACH3X1_007160 [Trebouxia sp. C0004]
MVDRFSYGDSVHHPWLHSEPQDCVTTNISPVSVLHCPSYTDAPNLSGQQATNGWSPDKSAYGTGGHTYDNAAVALPVQSFAVPSLADVHVSAAHQIKTTDGSQHVRRPNSGHNDGQPSSLDDRSSSSSPSSSRSISRRNKRSRSRGNRVVKGKSQTGSKQSDSRSCIRRRRSTQNGGNPSLSVLRRLDAQPALQSQHIALQYSWGPDSAAQGQIDLIAWMCATDAMGQQWSESGLAAHSGQILPSALTLSERARVGALGSAAWQEQLQTVWNGDLLVFTMPPAEADGSHAHRPHAELHFVRLAGLLRASGQALAGTIALHAADGNDKCLLGARLWVTASRGTIDTIFDMVSPEAQQRLEAAVPAMFQADKHAELTFVFGMVL